MWVFGIGPEELDTRAEAEHEKWAQEALSWDALASTIADEGDQNEARSYIRAAANTTPARPAPYHPVARPQHGATRMVPEASVPLVLVALVDRIPLPAPP